MRITIFILMIGIILAAPETTTPISNEIGVVKVEKLETDAVPEKINIQGYITNAQRQPIHGEILMNFKFYDAQTGGNLIWESPNINVNVDSGLFSVTFSIPVWVFLPAAERWLEIWVDGNQFPRVEITSVGFAFRSVKSDTASYSYTASIQRPITPPIARDEIADNAINSAKIENNTVTDDDLNATGVSAGTYGSATEVPQITINSKGRITNASNVSISVPSHSHNLTLTGDVTGSGSVSGTISTTIASGAVTTSKIADNAVNSAKIQDGTITGSDIANYTIGQEKLNFTPGDITSVNAGTGLTGGGNSGDVTLAFNTSWGDARYAPISGGSGYIQNQSSSFQNASFAISGQGRARQGFYADNGGGTFYTTGQIAVVGHTSYSGDRTGGYFVSSGGGSANVGARFGSTNYRCYGIGNCSSMLETKSGLRIMFSQESPEPLLEDFGYGKLTNGYCHIELDPLFLDCIKVDEQHPLKVFIQLNDDCNGVYVKVGKTGFDVYELNGGKSNASFTYRVIANRKDTDFLRFPPSAKIEPPKEPELKLQKIGGE